MIKPGENVMGAINLQVRRSSAEKKTTTSGDTRSSLTIFFSCYLFSFRLLLFSCIFILGAEIKLHNFKLPQTLAHQGTIKTNL
jgi:hypothetical protein